MRTHCGPRGRRSPHPVPRGNGASIIWHRQDKWVQPFSSLLSWSLYLLRSAKDSDSARCHCPRERGELSLLKLPTITKSTRLYYSISDEDSPKGSSSHALELTQPKRRRLFTERQPAALSIITRGKGGSIREDESRTGGNPVSILCELWNMCIKGSNVEGNKGNAIELVWCP